MPGRIAIIAALESELKPLVRGWKKFREGGLTLYQSDTAVAVAAGIGSAPAAMAAMVLVAREQPSCLVSAGLAGALRADLHVGQVLFPGTVVSMASGKKFVVSGGEGALLTARVIAGPERKRALRKEFLADALEMEAAGVATVAESCGLPFIAVKAISDELDAELPPLMRFVDTEGKLHTGSFVGNLLLHPSWWPLVWRLYRDSRRAATALAADLAKRIVELHGQLQKARVHQPVHAVSHAERN